MKFEQDGKSRTQRLRVFTTAASLMVLLQGTCTAAFMNVHPKPMTTAAKPMIFSLEHPSRQKSTSLFYNDNNSNNKNNNDDDRSGSSSSSSFGKREMDELNERLFELRRTTMEEFYKRPPNPELSPQRFISALFQALWENSDPLPDSGFRLLLRSSTKNWRTVLYHSVGAPLNANEEIVASALGEAMARPHNQYAILIGGADSDNADSASTSEEPEFHVTFPTDPLDYGDGTCWVECQMRDASDDSLIAITGWQLFQRPSDGAWLVDRIDWQDFRDEYRPGIGRVEWERICG